VLSAADAGGELGLLFETIARVVPCPDCGAVARAKDRPPVWVRDLPIGSKPVGGMRPQPSPVLPTCVVPQEDLNRAASCDRSPRVPDQACSGVGVRAGLLLWIMPIIHEWCCSTGCFVGQAVPATDERHGEHIRPGWECDDTSRLLVFATSAGTCCLRCVNRFVNKTQRIGRDGVTRAVTAETGDWR
jgi:hypothetical protein